MAFRTTRDAVKATIETSLTDAQINRFILDASRWVDEELATLGQLSAHRLEQIERYLACAWIRNRDLGLKAAKFDDITETYQVHPEISDYLLTAAAIDTTGVVRKWLLAPPETSTVLWRTATPLTEDSASDT